MKRVDPDFLCLAVTTGAGNVWTYKTAHTGKDMLAENYFGETAVRLRRGDWILANADNAPLFLLTTDVSKPSRTVTVKEAK